MDRYETASLRFLVEARDGTTPEETWNHILESFLSEARTRYCIHVIIDTAILMSCIRNELDKIMDTPQQAFFTLLSHPEYPVRLHLTKGTSIWTI